MSKVKVADKKTDLKRGVDHIGISMANVVHDGKGKILLMKRGPKARDEQGRWDVVSGALEFGESFEDGIRREIAEEISGVPIEIEFITTYDAHRVNEGKNTHWVAIVHWVKINPEGIKIGEPHKIDEIKWFDIKNLPSPMHSQFHKIYKALEDTGRISV